MLTNRDLEDRLNRLFDTGNEAMRLSRSEFCSALNDFRHRSFSGDPLLESPAPRLWRWDGHKAECT